MLTATLIAIALHLGPCPIGNTVWQASPTTGRLLARAGALHTCTDRELGA